MSHVTRFESLDPSEWSEWLYQHPLAKHPSRGKLFLGERLGLEAMEVSLNTFPPGAGMPFAHRHRENEELYLFLRGRGEMKVDDDAFEVTAGSAVRVAPEGARIYRNVGEEPLVFLVIQARPCGRPVRGIEDGEIVR